MSGIDFLSFEDVMDIHRSQLENFGGQDGFIDEGVVRSAIAQPQLASQYLGADIPYLAGAYLFHIAATQGFMDGNKRTATNAALQFLYINGYDLNASPDELYEMAMKVANHQMQKEKIAEWIRSRLIPGSNDEVATPSTEA